MKTLNLDHHQYQAAIDLLKQMSVHLKESTFAAALVTKQMLKIRESMGICYVAHAHIDGIINQENLEKSFAQQEADLFWQKLDARIDRNSQNDRMVILKEFARVHLDETMILSTIDLLPQTAEQSYVVDHLIELKSDYLKFKDALIQQSYEFMCSQPAWQSICSDRIDKTTFMSSAKCAIESALRGYFDGKRAFNMEVHKSMIRQKKAMSMAERYLTNKTYQ